MDQKNPYIINMENVDFENYATDDETEYPFEFSITKLWSESFFENAKKGSDNPYQSLMEELQDIKEITLEIRDILTKIFKE